MRRLLGRWAALRPWLRTGAAGCRQHRVGVRVATGSLVRASRGGRPVTQARTPWRSGVAGLRPSPIARGGLAGCGWAGAAGSRDACREGCGGRACRLSRGGAALSPWPHTGAAGCPRPRVGVAMPPGRLLVRREVGGRSCMRRPFGGPNWRACARRRTQAGDLPPAARPGRGTERDWRRKSRGQSCVRLSLREARGGYRTRPGPRRRHCA